MKSEDFTLLWPVCLHGIDFVFIQEKMDSNLELWKRQDGKEMRCRVLA